MAHQHESGRSRLAPDGPEAQKLRAFLARKRGKSIKSVKDLEMSFRRGDRTGNGNLSLAEFKETVSLMEKDPEADAQQKEGYPVALDSYFKEDELDRLFYLIDSNRKGYVAFDNFFLVVKQGVSMSHRRKKLIEFVFDKLDVDKSGLIDHTKVRKFLRNRAISELLEKKEADVIESIMKEFDGNKNCNNSNNNVEDKGLGLGFSRADFEDYYAGLSYFTESDRKFEEAVSEFWKLSGTEMGLFVRLINQERSMRGITKSSSSSSWRGSTDGVCESAAADVGRTTILLPSSLAIPEETALPVASDAKQTTNTSVAVEATTAVSENSSCKKETINSIVASGKDRSESAVGGTAVAGAPSSPTNVPEGKLSTRTTDADSAAAAAVATSPSSHKEAPNFEAASLSATRNSIMTGTAALAEQAENISAFVAESRQSIFTQNSKPTSKAGSRRASMSSHTGQQHLAVQQESTIIRSDIDAKDSSEREREREKKVLLQKTTASIFAELRRKRSSFPEDNTILRLNVARLALGLPKGTQQHGGAATSAAAATTEEPPPKVGTDPKTGSKEGRSTSTALQTSDSPRSTMSPAGAADVAPRAGVGEAAAKHQSLSTVSHGDPSADIVPSAVVAVVPLPGGQLSPRPPEKPSPEKPSTSSSPGTAPERGGGGGGGQQQALLPVQPTQGDSPRNASSGGLSVSRHGKLKSAIASYSSTSSINTPNAITALPSAVHTAPGTEPGTPVNSNMRRSPQSAPVNMLSSSPMDVFLAFIPGEAAETVRNIFEEMEELRKENAELKEKTSDCERVKGKMELLLSENMDLRMSCGELRAQLEAAERSVVDLINRDNNLNADPFSPTAVSFTSTLSSSRSSHTALGQGVPEKRSLSSMAAGAVKLGPLRPVSELQHVDDASSELGRVSIDLHRAQDVIEAQRHTISSQEATIALLERMLAAQTIAIPPSVM